MVKCIICNKEFTNNKSISYHFSQTHNLDYIKYLVNNKVLIVPKCAECNKEIDIFSKNSRGRTRILNHPEELKYCSNECMFKNEDYKNNMIKYGKINSKYITNRKQSDSEKLKKSIKTKENWAKNKQNIIKNMKGKLRTNEQKINYKNAANNRSKRTKEHCNNISKAICNGYISGKYYNHKITYFSKYNNKNIYFMSSYEFKLGIILDLLNIKWKYQWIYLKNEETGKRYLPDFYFEIDNKKYIVEIDRYKGFKEKTGYGWKLELLKKYCLNNDINYLYWDLTDINEFYLKYFKEINFSNIKILQQQDKYIEIISKYLSELFIMSNIKFDTNEQIKDIKIPEYINKINNRKFKENNNKFLKSIYMNYYECKWNNARYNSFECLKNIKTLNTIIKNTFTFYKELNQENILKQISKERYTISFFPDSWAFWIYEKTLDKVEGLNILDITGGFGGRLLGFNHFIKKNNIKDYNYTYIDLNIQTCNNTKILVNKLNMNNVKIINDKFENTNIFNNKYDLLFTSIPYFDIEIYNDINLQKIYNNKENFILKFINKIFELDCEKIILNISNKYKDILFNDFTNFNNYKLINTYEVLMQKHPFEEEDKVELFFEFKVPNSTEKLLLQD